VEASRSRILEAVRRARPAAPAALPGLEGLGAPAADREAAFAAALEAAGGRCLRAGSAEALGAPLAAHPAFAAARSVYAALPGVPGAREGREAAAAFRAAGGLDFAVLPGAFGVAENGAVWVDAGALPDRSLLWLAEHLVLAVPASELVDDLHAAYARLRLGTRGFGVFVAGPSKTADIEQALVVGAQGPRTTWVVLVGAAG
jgi:L-lactate dehydrogenase complex protein LldG